MGFTVLRLGFKHWEWDKSLRKWEWGFSKLVLELYYARLNISFLNSGGI